MRDETDKITVCLNPSEFAAVKGITVTEVFKMIRAGTIEYVLTDNGLTISITYIISN